MLLSKGIRGVDAEMVEVGKEQTVQPLREPERQGTAP